jgi:hypothetical protein
VAIVHGGPANGTHVPDRLAYNFAFNANRPQSPYYSATHEYEVGDNGDIYWVNIGSSTLGSAGMRGWADLQRAVNVAIPTGTARAGVLRRAAHGKLRQRRRIR